MYDQSFCELTLAEEIRSKDLRAHPLIANHSYRAAVLLEGTKAAASSFGGSNPLKRLHIKGKDAFRVPLLSNELVLRKLTSNIARHASSEPGNRGSIVANLTRILEEGLPYRVYRLDIKSYYESIDRDFLLQQLSAVPGLSGRSIVILKALLQCFGALGGVGLPRGLALSARLSEVVMKQFDSALARAPNVHFYARFVDDIVIVTSADELSADFISLVKSKLPPGMTLNTLKQIIVTAKDKVAGQKTRPKTLFSFEYLGYSFSVSEPLRKATDPLWRKVDIGIAKSKVKKIKTRVSRSFISFSRNGDFPLLNDRIKLLTSNVSTFDHSTGKFVLAGIYHSYPAVCGSGMESITELDTFLKRAILEKNRTFSAANGALSGAQKRTLLGRSFSAGHARKIFTTFPSLKMLKLQKCWLYA